MIRRQEGQSDESEPRTISVRARGEGRIETTSSGRPPTGKKRKLANEATVSNLTFLTVLKWNEVWDRVELEPDQDSEVDAWCYGPAKSQPMQVTVLPHNPEVWKAYARNGFYRQQHEPTRHAKEIIDAIRAKQSRYSMRDRSNLILILDGSWFANYAFEDTLTEYSTRYLREARDSGFGDIFLLTSMYLYNLLNPPIEDWKKAA